MAKATSQKIRANIVVISIANHKFQPSTRALTIWWTLQLADHPNQLGLFFGTIVS